MDHFKMGKTPGTFPRLQNPPLIAWGTLKCIHILHPQRETTVQIWVLEKLWLLLTHSVNSWLWFPRKPRSPFCLWLHRYATMFGCCDGKTQEVAAQSADSCVTQDDIHTGVMESISLLAGPDALTKQRCWGFSRSSLLPLACSTLVQALSICPCHSRAPAVLRVEARLSAFDTNKAVSWAVRAVIPKYHRLGALQTTDMYFSQFWRLEVQDQADSMSGENPLSSEKASSHCVLMGWNVPDYWKALPFHVCV